MDLKDFKLERKYNIIYGRLAGKHKIVLYSGSGEDLEAHYEINTDFICEYNLDNFDECEVEGFQTCSAIFGEKDVKYEDLIMGQLYFLLTNRDNCVIYFEKVKDEDEFIEIEVGEEPLAWFTASKIPLEYF